MFAMLGIILLIIESLDEHYLKQRKDARYSILIFELRKLNRGVEAYIRLQKQEEAFGVQQLLPSQSIRDRHREVYDNKVED